MDSTYTCKIFSMFRVSVWFVILLFSVCSVQSLEKNKINGANQTRNTTQEDLNMIRAYLKKINKPGIKTIQSPDGDIIDCVLSHKQLAFDHPLLKGQKPLDPPKGYNLSMDTSENFQLWSMSGESCPDGTVPIRRVTEQDILQFGNIYSSFGRKTIRPLDSANGQHEYAGAFATSDVIYGARAHINIWAPRVDGGQGFSSSKIWLLAGDGDDINSVEAGWQVYPQQNRGDAQPRLFVYWTRDGSKTTGCYNFMCPGFVQVSNRITPGAAIAPVSSYGGSQKDVMLFIFKHSDTADWWLQYGDRVIGYWPSGLHTHLKDCATRVQYGGEIVNIAGQDGEHTSTEMGSGHFAEEAFGKAAFFRHVELLNLNNTLVTPSNIKLLADRPGCYNVKKEESTQFGYQFYFGGPGRNPNCLR